MSVNSDSETTPQNSTAQLLELDIANVVPNERNPRLDFPREELDRLTDSIDLEGVLVPIVVYPKGEKYVLVDGERRFRCARDLGHQKIPALITTERSEREVLQQMFNIHLIREPWRDIPTAKALQRLAEEIRGGADGHDPNDHELRDLTGLSIERVRQLRYVVTLPDEWQTYIREGIIPLNFFWELKKNVIDALRVNRPGILEAYGEERVREAFVQKRLAQVITDTVSLRKVSPIIKFAAQEETAAGDASIFDASIRDLIDRPEATIDDAYEDTVQMMVEVEKLGRRTASMVSVFRRLLAQTADTPDNDEVKRLGHDLIDQIRALMHVDEQQG